MRTRSTARAMAFLFAFFVALLSAALLFADAAPASAKGESSKYGKVTWTDEKTFTEKILEVTERVKDHLQATGMTLHAALKDHGVDVSKGLAAASMKVSSLFKKVDTRDLSERLQEAAAKVQKSLEEQLGPTIKKMGESMIHKQHEAEAGDGKEGALSEEDVESLTAELGAETVAELAKSLEEGLMRSLERENPSTDDVAAELAKAKEGVAKISAWADQMYKAGVPVEKIKKLLETAGLHAREEEGSEGGAAAHDEL